MNCLCAPELWPILIINQYFFLIFSRLLFSFSCIKLTYVIFWQCTKYATKAQGQNRDKHGQNRDRQGQHRERQGQNRDKQEQIREEQTQFLSCPWFVPACPCFVPVCPYFVCTCPCSVSIRSWFVPICPPFVLVKDEDTLNIQAL